MQNFLGSPESGLLNLEAHWLALAIAKKTLDENCFMAAQKTMDREPPSFRWEEHNNYWTTYNKTSGSNLYDLSTTSRMCKHREYLHML